jgi:hypothetical protein
MRKGVEKAGLFRFACAAHVGQLVVESMLVELQLCDLLDDFNTYFAPAAGLVTEAGEAGIQSNQLRSADYKFAYALPVTVTLTRTPTLTPSKLCNSHGSAARCGTDCTVRISNQFW